MLVLLPRVSIRTMRRMMPLLKEWREFRGLTQEQVAVHLEKSDATIARWESGGRIPGVDDLVVLAKLFDCRPQDLWDPPDQPHGTPLDRGLLDRVVVQTMRKVNALGVKLPPEKVAAAIVDGYEAGASNDSRTAQRAAIERVLKAALL